MAINNTTNSNFRNKSRDIKYLNKDFQGFRNNLIEYAKTYFPTTYSDFNETSPGMMFIEMASYIGDVLGYYIDDTFKESLLPFAEDVRSVNALSQFLGYKPKVTSPSVTTLSLYQLVPAIGSGANNRPDEKYYLKIKEGMGVQSSENDVDFRVTDSIDFSDPFERELTVYERDVNTGEPTFYLAKKNVKAISSIQKTLTQTVGSFEAYRTIDISDTNVVQIVDVRDSNGNKYYEVPYLAQEMVYVERKNSELTDPDLAQFKETVPYLLRTLKTNRRFVTRVNENNTTTIQFGAGDSTTNDELLIPNLKNVGLGLPNSIDRLSESFDPTNFLKTKTYGVSPSNTTLTIKYYVGGGVESNVPIGTITRITAVDYEEDLNSFTPGERGVYSTVKNSLAVDNEVPAVGGRGSETIDEVRQNALANFGSQNRAVTAQDYQVRALSLPPKFGSIAKAYASADGKLDNNSPSSILASPNALQQFTDLVLDFVNRSEDSNVNRESISDEIRDFLVGKQDNINEKNNPFAINLYLLGYNSSGQLTTLNRAVKDNLKRYLNDYRILTDGVNLIDGFIVNIGVEFEIVTYQDYNKSEVITNCINELIRYFNIDNWAFNQTINLGEIELLLGNIEGVSSVPKIEITNKCNGQYSSNSYNITAATKDKIIYPSLDPCVFEVKFPNSDIKGRAR